MTARKTQTETRSRGRQVRIPLARVLARPPVASPVALGPEHWLVRGRAGWHGDRRRLSARSRWLVGKGVAEAIDPTVEEGYWRDNYATRPYVEKGASFDDYGPAYRHGVDSYGRSNGRTFEQSESDLERSWER